MPQLNNVVDTYIKYGKRDVADIPALLENISTFHHIKMPDIKGIDTKKYWKDNLGQSNTMTM